MAQAAPAMAMTADAAATPAGKLRTMADWLFFRRTPCIVPERCVNPALSLP